jgi:hypothetical protein
MFATDVALSHIELALLSFPKQLRNMIRMSYTGVIGKEWVG